jgi:hypothetical protein
MTKPAEHPEAIAESTAGRVVEGFVVPERRGPRFKDELRWKVDLALGRILACLRSELGPAEAAEVAAEVFEARLKGHFKVQKKPAGRPSLSKSKKERLLALSDMAEHAANPDKRAFSRRKIASKLAGTSGWPKEPEAIEQEIKRLRSKHRPKRPAKIKLVVLTD